MFTIAEQFSLASKAVIEAQLASVNAFVHAAVDSGSSVFELNLEAVRTSLAATTVAAKQLLAVKDPRELFSFGQGQSKLAIDRIRSYGREAHEIAQGSHSKFAEVAKSEFAASHQKIGELLQVAKQAPDSVMLPINNFYKTASSGAHEGYDKSTRTGK
ncbi:phasin family protein [Janthinobacterium agaricidamnosum]|uniref:Phasin family domain protein n=1 Tax=Janthinobacterium agaricidamnosum NBRC 102515 = DSM 9628 TaxID=1349767 RepID=W0VDL2_9BURK|nr:phasin family protein [Janthinobacterium agaricidamnosum]CDG85765.1 phasin family domain protein [Janthinobacterium agaricidamnosum NBRC 102515 = DSM 9628]